MPVFLAHVLINTKFMFKRWGLHNDKIIDLLLILVGIISYILIIMVR